MNCSYIDPLLRKVDKLASERIGIEVIMSAINFIIIEKTYLENKWVISRLIHILIDRLVTNCDFEEILMEEVPCRNSIRHKSHHYFIINQLMKADYIIEKRECDIATWWKFIHKAISMHFNRDHDDLYAFIYHGDGNQSQPYDHHGRIQ